jgi:hypothetical protein
VASDNDEIRRYNAATGAFVGVFASGGGLVWPRGMCFGPDGNLYVNSSGSGAILRYHGMNGAFIDVFASGGELSPGPVGLVFNPTPEPPSLKVHPASLDFGLVLTGATAPAVLMVSNAGAWTLSGTAALSGGPFTIGDSLSESTTNVVFNVPALSSTNIPLRFAPVVSGAFSNAVVFASNGGDSTNAIRGRSISAPSILNPNMSNGAFAFSFEALAGNTYLVQYKDSLDDLAWQTFQSVTGDASMISITNFISAASQRFFRLRVE